MRRRSSFNFIAFSLILTSGAFAQTPTFTTSPTLTQDVNGKWWVDFAISQNSDVEVSIVNPADSTVVRHLAAGVLGASTPSPLAPNSLSQKIGWDGKDDLGKVVSNASSLAVRVRAGMSVALKDIVGDNPYVFKGEGSGYYNFLGIAADPNGDIYLYGSGNNNPCYTIRQYDGNGNYKKTVYPYPANLTSSEVQGYGVNTWADGHYSPKLPSSPWGKDLGIPNFSKTIISQGINTLWPSVENDEITVITIPTLGYIKVKTNGALVGTGASKPLVTTPPLPGNANGYYIGGPINFCFAPDKKFVYLSGIYEGVFLSGVPVTVADTGFWKDGQVFKVNLQTGVATSLIKLDSVPKTNATRTPTIGPIYQGNGDLSLKAMAAIHGVATDDSGHIFICDRFHQQIGVYDTLGAFLGAIPVKWPDLVEVNKATGDIYVATRNLNGYHTGIVSLFKYSGWRNGGTLAASLPNFVTNVGEEFGSAYAEKIYMALKQSATQPVLWFSSNSSNFDPSDNSIWAIRDDGNKLTVIKDFYQLSKGQNVGFVRIAVDRRTDVVYVNDAWDGIRKIENWANPQILPCSTSAHTRIHASDMAISPDHNLYLREGSSFSGPITRYTLDHLHAPVNFANSGKNILTPYIYGRYGMVLGSKGLAVNTNGQVAVMWMYNWMKYFISRYDNQATIDTAQGTAIVNPIPAEGGGLQYDLQGNLYAGIGYRGTDHQTPSGFTGDYGYDKGVGAVIKFNAGTMGSVSENGLGVDISRSVTGAAKIYKPGLGAMSFNCWCQTPRFEVDPYGRLFIPNAVTSQVAVVDNAGNQILQFGQYGNVDSRGPGSLIPTPAIPLAYPMGAAASEDFIYVTDLANARLVRVKMNYALDNMPNLTNKTSVSAARVAPSQGLSLSASPNPFTPSSTVKIFLPQTARVKLDVIDASGRVVKTLTEGELSAGTRSFVWNGTGADNRRAAAGTYLYRMIAGNQVLTKKVSLAR